MTTLGEYVKVVTERIMECGGDWPVEEELADASMYLRKCELSVQQRRWFWQQVADRLFGIRELDEVSTAQDKILELHEIVIKQMSREGPG